MKDIEKWIWLPEAEYPNHQTTVYSSFMDKANGNYTVAEFQRTYAFDKKIQTATLRFSGDTRFELYCNNQILATGPVMQGGDYEFGGNKPKPNYYASVIQISPDTDRLDFYARVTMMPVLLCEFSQGHGGFMLTAHITFEDGTKTVVTTDKTWKVRRNGAYTAPYRYDTRIVPDAYMNAQEISNIWHTETAPIPVRQEEEIYPENNRVILRQPDEEKEVLLDLDMIYSGFVHVFVKTEGIVQVDIYPREGEETAHKESLVFRGDEEYRGSALHSAGNLQVYLKNDADTASEVAVSLISTHYPIEKTAMTITSDQDLNAVLDVCRHTLKICRQTIHLDSPRHCEPLGCTGDYYIEMLMTMFSFGDMTLVKFDMDRIAENFRYNNGRVFHTTYALIWVRMLYDAYNLTGDREILCRCEDALHLLLQCYRSYIGENGLIETPPDYMFVDWIYVDEFSLHHPPKALGQTCLNLFYYSALDAAAKIFDILSEPAMAKLCLERKETLGKAINGLLYDPEKGLYFEGLNTPTPEHLLSGWMPQNTDKRYYLKHSNILAAYVGVCDKESACSILDKIMKDECPGEYQPYFAHFLLEAIYQNGLRDKYTMQVLEKWKKPTKECAKGLVEGFIAPDKDYGFDHSHAWGGTPLYSLPKALLGLEINGPGLTEITLQPSLLGLQNARVELPTPYGDVVCEMSAGKEPVVTYPEAIRVNVKSS